jgi:nitrate reductase gamma subunit
MTEPAPEREPPRLSTLAFVLLIVGIPAITVILVTRHAWWGYLGIASMTVMAFIFRGRVRAPEWSDALDRRTPALESALALALGLVTLVLGIFFCLVVPVVVVASVIEGEFAYAVLNLLLGGPAAVGMVVGGRWLMKNRRLPFGGGRPPITSGGGT